MLLNSRYAVFYVTMGTVLALSLANNGRGIRGAVAQASPLPERAAPFLDRESLRHQESAIVSALRDDSRRRSLATNGTCMEDLYGSKIGCTSQDVKFLAITGVTVYDKGAYLENGIWKGACLGKDDYVNLAFTANLEVSATRYDFGMYINTEGGSAFTGTCALALLSQKDFKRGTVAAETYNTTNGPVKIGEIETGTAADYCPDLDGPQGGATLTNFPFAKLRLKCFDTPVSGGVGDGLLDFDIGIAWDNGAGTYCNPNSTSTWPIPGTSAKCWHGTRFTVDVHVPPYNTPSSQPSISSMPSSAPSKSSEPSSRPSVSSKPSASPSTSTHPSQSPSISTRPSASPSVSARPSSHPSSKPSSDPSSSPSVSAKPSSHPSSKPSSDPSSSPSVSFKPSSHPSSIPSSSPSNRPSNHPSNHPSISPSVSAHPSSIPSISPSVSSQPSLSAQPSTSTEFPSSSPSISAMPSRKPSSFPSSSPSADPSSMPSRDPSDRPSSIPSVSPSSRPSANPSESPSVSHAPTFNTPAPSESPSISKEPSNSPSSSPSISSMPSSSPSVAPSESPSASPTGSLYYPDWINEEQVCKNDGADPEYMMQVQKDNYLYRSKEECCQNHFWWRIQQCMGNEKPMYYSNGSFCDQKVFFEDWESKYTPGSWDASDQFETLQECCVAKFWYDVEGCIAASPKELSFTFSFTVNNIILPTNCQDADIMGNALETAINVGLGSSSISQVTQIGCASLSRNADTDNTECGGCLAGSFLGDFDGTRPAGYYDSSASATVSVKVSTKSSDCSDSACFQSLYSSIISEFTAFVNSGDLTTEIVSWAQNRVPPIPELWNSQVATTSFSTSGSYTDPFNDPNGVITATSITTTGKLSVSGFPTITTSAELQEATAYFEAAITDTLEGQGALPDGAIVTVTGISNGVVQYEITINADSTAVASQVVSQISTSLSQPSTLTSITTAVQTESSGGTLSMTSLSVNSNTSGSSTETAVIKATSTGQLATSVSTSGLSDVDIGKVKAFFENAITETLQAEGVLPVGSYVTVTGITNGVVNYELTMYNDPSADLASIASSIESTLSKTSTLTTIQDSVKSDAIGVISATSVTTAGVLSVSGFPTINTPTEFQQATAYFEAAITYTLEGQGALPDGAIVTVTGISNGVVEYEVTISADSVADASQAVSQINTSLSQSSTLTAITSAVQIESSGGSLSMTSLSVNSNTAGTSTESTVSKVTSAGQLTTSVSTTGLSLADVNKMATFFEDSITRELDTLLPPGSYVTVTGITNGVVNYQITMYNDPSSDGSSIVSTINSALSQTSTWTAIINSVQSDSAGTSLTTALSTITVSGFTAGDTAGIANSGSFATALSTLTVSGFTAGATTGIPDNKWHPDFVNQKNGCINNGLEPTYMKGNPNYYLFSSKQECCDQWFSYDQFCGTSTSTKKKFYPDLSTGLCGRKQEKEFESFERDRYDTLEECCSAKFSSYNFDKCCSAPGLGGCAPVGPVVYLPNWSTSVCFSKSETAVAEYEKDEAFSSASACCTSAFGWKRAACCKAAGGC